MNQVRLWVKTSKLHNFFIGLNKGKNHSGDESIDVGAATASLARMASLEDPS